MFITSCSDLEFVYKENTNLGNPIYNKTEYNITCLYKYIYIYIL